MSEEEIIKAEQQRLSDRLKGDRVKNLTTMYVARALDENKIKTHESIVEIGMAMVLGGFSVLSNYFTRPGIVKWTNRLINEVWGHVH